MVVPSPALFARFRDRIEVKGARHGLVYPWWIPVVSTLGLAGGAVGGAAQRWEVAPHPLLLLAVVLAVGSCVAHFVITPWLPWWLELAVVTAGVALLLLNPVSPDESIDLAPVTLAFVVGEITATDGARRGLVGVATSAATLLLLGDYGSDLMTLYTAEVLVGLVFGSMLRWQMRALAAEHAARDEEGRRATLAERQRVASEIHDLVAHSLSVTMLHVTGARRALEQDADIPDAVAALTDAERIGRQAMADIRRTVSVLATDATSVAPLPGAGDLDTLVEGFRGAGLQVTLTTDGDLQSLPPATGLGLYRVVQESLTNVVKHAPGAPAVVQVRVAGGEARLSVTNPVPVVATVGSGGSGLTGMASRVSQLGGRIDAGARGDRWRVELVVPVDVRADLPVDDHDCVVRRMLPS